MSEHSIEQHLVRQVSARGAWCVKGENTVGFPDRIVLASHGRVAFVELKAPGGRFRSVQRRVCHGLKALGFRVEVLYSNEDVDAFVEDFFGGV